MAGENQFAMTWVKNTTATTTITTDADAVWDANPTNSGVTVRPRHVTFFNDDDTITISVKTQKGGALWPVLAGEIHEFDLISDGLWVDAASGTPAYRALARG